MLHWMVLSKFHTLPTNSLFSAPLCPLCFALTHWWTFLSLYRKPLWEQAHLPPPLPPKPRCDSSTRSTLHQNTLLWCQEQDNAPFLNHIWLYLGYVLISSPREKAASQGKVSYRTCPQKGSSFKDIAESQGQSQRAQTDGWRGCLLKAPGTITPVGRAGPCGPTTSWGSCMVP